MKLITTDDIHQMERLQRINLINSITGYKPANLIGTINNDGQTNLTIFSSVIHLGSAPPLLGMISRPDVVDRHTLSNIQERKQYTINHISIKDFRRAHYTSAKFPSDVSEFDMCDFTPHFIEEFVAPVVMESPVQIGLHLEETVELPNGTVLIIGAVKFIRMKEEAFHEETGSIDFPLLESVCLTGLDTYYKTELIGKMPYAKVEYLTQELIKATDSME